MHPAHPEAANGSDASTPRQSHPGTGKALRGFLRLREMKPAGLSSHISIIALLNLRRNVGIWTGFAPEEVHGPAHEAHHA